MFKTSKTRSSTAAVIAALTICTFALPTIADARPIKPQDRAKAEALKKAKSDCDYYKDMADKHHAKKNSADAAGNAAQARRELESENYIIGVAKDAGCKWAGGSLY